MVTAMIGGRRRDGLDVNKSIIWVFSTDIIGELVIQMTKMLVDKRDEEVKTILSRLFWPILLTRTALARPRCLA